MVMSQTNTSTNNGQNRNQISGRGGRGRHGDCRNGSENNLIVDKYLFEGRMKDGPIYKLIITETGHWSFQYKKIIVNFPVSCTDKNYQGINDVTRTRNNLVETDFMLTYPDANQ